MTSVFGPTSSSLPEPFAMSIDFSVITTYRPAGRSKPAAAALRPYSVCWAAVSCAMWVVPAELAGSGGDREGADGEPGRCGDPRDAEHAGAQPTLPLPPQRLGGDGGPREQVRGGMDHQLAHDVIINVRHNGPSLSLHWLPCD